MIPDPKYLQLLLFDMSEEVVPQSKQRTPKESHRALKQAAALAQRLAELDARVKVLERGEVDPLAKQNPELAQEVKQIANDQIRTNSFGFGAKVTSPIKFTYTDGNVIEVGRGWEVGGFASMDHSQRNLVSLAMLHTPRFVGMAFHLGTLLRTAYGM